MTPNNTSAMIQRHTAMASVRSGRPLILYISMGLYGLTIYCDTFLRYDQGHHQPQMHQAKFWTTDTETQQANHTEIRKLILFIYLRSFSIFFLFQINQSLRIRILFIICFNLLLPQILLILIITNSIE